MLYLVFVTLYLQVKLIYSFWGVFCGFVWGFFAYFGRFSGFKNVLGTSFLPFGTVRQYFLKILFLKTIEFTRKTSGPKAIFLLGGIRFVDNF